MRSPVTVLVVQHLHVHANGEECVKMIGVYSNRAEAEQAVTRQSSLSGFRDHPHIIDPLRDERQSGFYIDEYQVGQDHWTEGFVTCNSFTK